MSDYSQQDKTELLQQLDTALDRQLQSYAISKVLLGLSGGLDSMLLLHLLVRWQSRAPGRQLQAMHVHHGLSVNADHWADVCQYECQKHGVPLLVRHLQLNVKSNIEAQARTLRYQVLAEQLAMLAADEGGDHSSGAASALLTAHHADDQLETLLLALKRGSGPAGLAGIANAKPCGTGWLLRPLLDFERSQLEAAASQLQLSWVNDESNLDSRFDRNFLRLEVLPLLKQRWPQFTKTSSRSIQQLGQVQQVNDQLLQQQLAAIAVDDSLQLAGLGQYQQSTQILLLRLWLKKFGLNPSADRLTRILQELVLAKADAEPQIMIEDFSLRRFAGQLYLLNKMQQQAATTKAPSLQPLLPNSTIELADGRILVWSKDKADFGVEASYWPLAVVLEQPLQLGFGWLSYRFKPATYPHHKALKQWCKLWKVPPWQRGSMPSIIAGQQILLVVDHYSACCTSEAQSWISVTKKLTK